MLLSACEVIPADIEDTRERVRETQVYRVGVIAGPVNAQRLEPFLAAVSQAADARPVLEQGATEPLLKKLERGALDIVVGPMAADSGWATHVHFMPLQAGTPAPPDRLQYLAMARNGENEWIALVHSQASAVAKQ
jgi:DNA-binding transcriptional LysR family regulator